MRLNRSFFEKNTIEVARNLIGSLFKFETSEGVASGVIIETEAYLGEEDKASHARFGRDGKGRLMFGMPGVAYVYLIYGMHYMFNVVTEPEGVAGAVLIRALVPVEGVELMKKRRRTEDVKNLTSGPARLTSAFGITLEQNGRDITTGPLGIWEYIEVDKKDVLSTPRIGVIGWKEKPWRFVLGEYFVQRIKEGGKIIES